MPVAIESKRFPLLIKTKSINSNAINPNHKKGIKFFKSPFGTTKYINKQKNEYSIIVNE